MPNAFEKRKMVRRRFMGPVSADMWGGCSNYRNLIAAGYTVRIFLNDREIKDVMAADPDAGTVTVPTGVLKGDVEIRLERSV